MRSVASCRELNGLLRRPRARAILLGTATTAVAATLTIAPASTSAPTPTADRTASRGVLTISRFGKGAAGSRPAKIVIARADGSRSRVLTTGWFSYVSPDGSQVAVVDSNVNWYTNQRLELYAPAGGAPRRVVDLRCVHVYWSPDSTKLACVELSTAAGKPTRLVLVDARSGANTPLATGFFDGQVSFSPDSAGLAYVQNPTEAFNSARGTLKVIDLASRAVRTIRTGAVSAPTWGPTEIAFATAKRRGRNFTYDTAVVKPDGSGFRRLTRFRPDLNLWGPYPVAWSADGTRLLAGMNGLDAWTRREAYAINPIRGGVRLIAHTVSPSALSRDGRYVIGQTGDEETTGLDRSNVVRVPWAGGTKRVLLRQAVEPSFNG
jgi:hypothetical protein